MRFGISTHLYHDQRLDRSHLAQVAAYGFEAVELFATRSHFDYHDEAAIDRLAQWLSETGVALHAVHAPVTESLKGGRWGPAFSNAAGDNARRQAAMRETDLALNVARKIPAKVLVVHLGTPRGQGGAADNSRAAAVRSAEEILRLAEPLGIQVAFEVIPNELSDAPSLVSMIEREFESAHVGICVDFGHAHLLGDVADAIETAAEHLVTTHIHDNRGREDEHLVPYLGTINWDTALMTMQKIGYEGTYLMEVADKGGTGAVLEDARRARLRIERALGR